MAIGSFKLPNTAGAAVDPDAWVRPADWLAMPTIGTQEFIGLLSITDDESNHIALLCAGAYTVDWGDGVTENVATGIKAQHTYTYSAISSGTLSTRGYKQVLVRVTPQAGQNLTTINLQQQNSILAKFHTVSWLDIAINGANITSLSLGGVSSVRLTMCERVNIGSIGAITNFTSMFSSLSSLQSVPLFNTASGTNFTSMFESCISLQSVPLFNTAAGTNFTSMFNNCFSLQSVPLFNTSIATNFTTMFRSCFSLRTVPLFNTPLVTNFTAMFNDCYTLQSVPLFNTASGITFTSMFTYCRSLSSVPLFNLSAGTNFTSMFQGCGIATSPLFNTASGVTFTSMFNDCTSLQLLPNFNTASGTNFSNMVVSSASLAKGAFQGTRYAISYTNMCLSQSAIVDIFNGLGTAVGTPTITVSNNPGRAALTAGEILIATAKGWIVV